MKFSESLDAVIALAETIRDYWDVELPKRHPDYPWVHPGEDSGPPPPEEKILTDFLLGLPEEDVYKIALVLCVAQGRFGTGDLAGHYEELKGMFGEPEEAVTLLVADASLADYLTEGLAELKKDRIDVDQLAFLSVNLPV